MRTKASCPNVAAVRPALGNGLVSIHKSSDKKYWARRSIPCLFTSPGVHACGMDASIDFSLSFQPPLGGDDPFVAQN